MSVQSITDELSDWLRRIPDRLRIDFSTLSTHINRESVSIFLHFYSCVNMTARPLVFYVIQRRLDAEDKGSATVDWKEGLSQNTVAVIESCVAAARATTLIMDAAAKHNLVGTSLVIRLELSRVTSLTPSLATYGYLDGEYIFSAALLLVMVNAAFPYNAANSRAMEISINLLRNMADRGNTNLAARHSLLLELRSSIGQKSSKQGDTAGVPVTPSSTQQPTPSQNAVDHPTGEVTWTPQQDIPSMQEISFNFDVNDDPGLWEEVLGQIDIDMDTDWIENTLKK